MGESGGWEGRFSRTSTGSILNNGIVLLARGTFRGRTGTDSARRGPDKGKKQRTGEVLCFLLYAMGCWRSLWAVGHSPAFGKELDVRNVNGWPYISVNNS